MHSKSIMRLSRLLTISVLPLLLIGCWGNGDGPSGVPDAPRAPREEQGLLMNSKVDNAAWFTSGGESGFTDNGAFPYFKGDTIEFFVGSILLGVPGVTVDAADLLTPVELTGSGTPTDQFATNMFVFLQTIDNNSPNSADGIQITDATLTAFTGQSLNFNSDSLTFTNDFQTLLDTVLDTVLPGTTIVSEEDALDSFCINTYLPQGGEIIFGFPFSGCEIGPDVELLISGDFEAPDADEGDIACEGALPPGWLCFNDAFINSNNFDEGKQGPMAHSPDQTLKIFGPFTQDEGAGVFQVVTVIPGQTYTASAWAQSWTGGVNSALNNIGIFQLTFLDGAGAAVDDGTFEVIVEPAVGGPNTYLPPDTWVKLSIAETAPAGTVSAQVQLLHIQINAFEGADPLLEGGSIFWDDASLIGPTLTPPPPPPFEIPEGFGLTFSDEFNDVGPVPVNAAKWTMEEGYGPPRTAPGWGNNEWQLYTTNEENVRVEGGNLVIQARCGSSSSGAPPVVNAALATFAEDFDALNINSSLALVNWKRYTSVWLPGPVGTGNFLYGYGGSAANASSGSGQMSAVASGEGANGAGDQYLNVFTDYANADLADGAYLSVSIFQEQTIAIGDIGSNWTFDFSGKAVGDSAFALAPPATGTAFIKTIDPNNNFAQTNLVTLDTSSLDPANWASFSLSIDLSDPLLAGQLLQFGFNVDTDGVSTPTGVYYDNINFTNAVIEPPEECDAGIRDGQITSARINTQTNFDFEYGIVRARIKTPGGLAVWPAFWMLGSDFPVTPWPNAGEIDIMEQFQNNSSPLLTNSALHFCDDRESAPAACTIDNGYVATPTTPIVDRLLFNGPAGDNWSSDFHIYELDWNAERIITKVDGYEVLNQEINPDFMEEFRKEFYLILNVAMGGKTGPGGDQPPSGNETYPQTMLVDWVRVYQAVQ